MGKVAPVMREVAPVMREVAPVMREVAPVMREVAPVMRADSFLIGPYGPNNITGKLPKKHEGVL